MGHLGQTKALYKKLIQRVDSYPVGILEDEQVHRLLEKLYTREEAFLVSKMPLKMMTAEDLSKRVGIKTEELSEKLRKMADKAIIFDLERNGKRYYAPMWSVPGFIEMTLMKVRDDIPQKEIAALMLEMFKDKKFVEAIFQGETQFGRALVEEKAALDTSDIMPYEVVTEVVREAKKAAVVLCYCRHKEEHAGRPCQYPMEVCMALDTGAEFVITHQYGREIEIGEALDVIEHTSELGLMHIGDNVKNHLGFICNCCRCCCGILRSYHDHGIFNVAVSSSYVMKLDENSCVGCGKCVEKCQLNAISVEKKADGKRKALIDQELCLGCGICYRACPTKSLSLQKREKRIITPESGLEKMIVMAIERGKLQDLIFDNVYSPLHSLLRNVSGALLRSNAVRHYLLKEKTRKKIMRLMALTMKKHEFELLSDM